MKQAHDGTLTLPKRPSLAEISTEIAALEDVIALRGRLVHSASRRPDFNAQVWERDARALAGLLKRLKDERAVIARETRG